MTALLLLSFLLPLAIAQSRPRVISLNTPSPQRTILTPFNLTRAPLTSLTPHNLTILTGASVITSARIESVQQTSSTSLLATSLLTFEGLPGAASIRVSVLDPGGFWISEDVAFDVIGIALHENEKAFPKDNVLLMKPLAEGGVGITVEAAVYGGMTLGHSPLDRSNIQISVGGADPNAAELLPWNAEFCKAAAEQDSLGDECGVAFAPDFTSLSLRARAELDEATITFEWPGLRDYLQELDGDVVDSDQVYSVRIATSETAPKAPRKGVPAWKIGAIGGGVAGVVLIVVIAIALWRRRQWSRFEEGAYASDRRDFGNNYERTLPRSIPRAARSEYSSPKLSKNTVVNGSEFDDIHPSPFTTDSVETVRVDVPVSLESVKVDDWSKKSKAEKKKKIMGANRRFALMDLLHGPASRGVCGPHGQPIQREKV